VCDASRPNDAETWGRRRGQNGDVAVFALLPFVENAFKHGISETRFDSFIDIRLQIKKGILDFRIENSKENIPLLPGNKNIGLPNVKRQLELTYKEYAMDVFDEEKVFKVHLHINLENHVEL